LNIKVKGHVSFCVLVYIILLDPVGLH